MLFRNFRWRNVNECVKAFRESRESGEEVWRKRATMVDVPGRKRHREGSADPLTDPRKLFRSSAGAVEDPAQKRSPQHDSTAPLDASNPDPKFRPLAEGGDVMLEESQSHAAVEPLRCPFVEARQVEDGPTK